MEEKWRTGRRISSVIVRKKRRSIREQSNRNDFDKSHHYTKVIFISISFLRVALKPSGLSVETKTN